MYTHPLQGPSGASRWTSAGFGYALAGALLVWLLDLLGAASLFDGLAYDACVRGQAWLRPLPARVLLVYVEHETAYQDAESLPRMVQELHHQGATRFGFTFQPGQAWDALASLDHGAGRELILGRELQPGRNDPRGLRYRTPVASATAGQGEAGVRTAAIVTGIPNDGVFRTQPASITLEQDGTVQSCLSLESRLAGRSLGTIQGPGDYGVAYRGGPGSLPHVSGQQVLQGGLVPELVAHRAVLFGLRPDPMHGGITTPTTTTSQRMSPLEYHGHALNTLLNGRSIQRLSPAMNLLALVLGGMLSVLIFQQCPVRLALVLFSGMLVVTFGAALGALCLACIWLPAAQLIAVQLVCLGVVFERKFMFWNVAASRLFMDLSLRLRRRRWQNSLASSEPWAQIVGFMHQTLHLQRLIILELPLSSYHVREVHAFHCSLSDVDERRRDVRRWPFSTAAETHRPVRITAQRPFLKGFHNDEQQLLVPLVFGGDLFGYFALGVDRQTMEASADFERILQDFADAVAELLYRRRSSMQDEVEDSGLLSLVTSIPEETVYRELLRASQLMERRLTRLETLFDNAGTPMAVYDIFGRLIMINGQMRDTLQAEQILAVEMTTVDLIVRLTGTEIVQARDVLRSVVSDRRGEVMKVQLGKKAYELRVWPLVHESAEAVGATLDDPAPFQTQGVICELNACATSSEVTQLRSHLSESLGGTLRNDLAAMDLAASMLTAPGLEEPERANFGEVIHGRVERAVSLLEDCQRFLDNLEDGEQEDCYPITVRGNLRDAWEPLESQALQRQITLDDQLPDLHGQVLAVPEQLTRALQAGLLLLLEDARDASQIECCLNEYDEHTELVMTSHGFGIPAEHLQAALVENQPTSMESLQRMRAVNGWLEGWGGGVFVSSETGSGVCVTYLLRRFLVS